MNLVILKRAGGACVLAIGAALAVLGLSSAAQAFFIPHTNCYSGAEGNTYFAIGGNTCSAPTSTTTTTTTGSSNRWDTTGFVGLSFSIGDGSFTPHIDLGVRETNVDTSGFVSGGEANLSVSLKDWNDTQFRVLGLVGENWLLGNAGIGWDIGKHSFILNGGAQAPYVRAFVDYAVDAKTWRAFLELNSLGQIQAAQELTVMQTTVSCGAGTVLANPTQILGDWASLMGGTSVVGDIFAGSFNSSFFGTQTFAGSQSTTTFLNGQTCYTQGTAPTPN